MFTDRRNQLIQRGLTGMLSSIFVAFLLAVSPTVFAQDYIGSDACSECHQDQFSEWSSSGHPYKLMASEDARKRPIPTPEGVAWDDISWVIGGYKWKSRYIDQNGYIITSDRNGPGNTQYNYLDGSWVDYHAGEV